MPIINDELEPKTYAETKGNLFDLVRMLAKQKPYSKESDYFDLINPIDGLDPINNNRSK